MAGGNACSGNRSCHGRKALPVSVVEYIERCNDIFEDQRFPPIRFAGDLGKVDDVCIGPMCDSAVGVWIRQWGNCSGRCANQPFLSFQSSGQFPCPLIEEVKYDRRFGDIFVGWRQSIFELAKRR